MGYHRIFFFFIGLQLPGNIRSDFMEERVHLTLAYLLFSCEDILDPRIDKQYYELCTRGLSDGLSDGLSGGLSGGLLDGLSGGLSGGLTDGLSGRLLVGLSGGPSGVLSGGLSGVQSG